MSARCSLKITTLCHSVRSRGSPDWRSFQRSEVAIRRLTICERIAQTIATQKEFTGQRVHNKNGRTKIVVHVFMRGTDARAGLQSSRKYAYTHPLDAIV